MFVIIFGGLPIMNVINNAMNIVKHFFYVVIHKKMSEKKYCVNWINIGPVGTYNVQA